MAQPASASASSADSTGGFLLETAFWTTAYLAYNYVFSRMLRLLYKKMPIWNHARRRAGVFCGNGRDDAVYCTLLCFHHGLAAYVMKLGVDRAALAVADGDTDAHDAASVTWRRGYLIETGFEVADTLCIFFRLYPYGEHDGMKPETSVIMLLHHAPGICLAPFVMSYAGLYGNVHLQTIAFWLLGGAFASCLTGLYMYAVDFDRHIRRVAAAFYVSIGFFLYCRFYQFPVHALNLLRDVARDEQLNGSVAQKILYAYGIMMTLFNVGVSVDAVPKLFRYAKRVLDGVTPIETEPVPPSRESILAGVHAAAGRRRRSSSLLRAVQTVTATAASRSSSFSTVMMLNPIEDVANAKKVQPVSAFDDDDDDGLDGLNEEDRKALKHTLSKISEKSNKSSTSSTSPAVGGGRNKKTN